MSTETKGKDLKVYDYDKSTGGELSLRNQQMNREVLDVLLFDPKAFEAWKGGMSNATVDSLEIKDISPFSVFDPKHIRSAHDAALQLSRKPKGTMLKALKYLRTAYPKSPFIEYMTRITLMKHPETRDASFPPPSQTLPMAYFTDDILFERNAKEQDIGTALVGPFRESDEQKTKTKFDKEKDLAWWREDIGLLEHNFNWHMVYPYPPNPPKDRQGELFAYMHQQMLARYDFERLALGFDRVQPYGPGNGWDRALTEGFNPRMMLCSFRPSEMFVALPDGDPGPRAIYEEMTRHKERLQDGIARGSLYNKDEVKIPVDMNKLGNTILANRGSINKNLYGEINNKGHQVISNMSDSTRKYQIPPGPMNWDQTAPRDPVFYRWHKFVDVLFDEHRKNLKPHTIPDLDFPGIEIQSFEVELEPEEYHKKKVDTPMDKKNNFYTYTETKEYTVYNLDPEKKVNIKKRDFVNHIPFRYKISLKNKNKNDAMVLLRVFLAPETDEPLENWRNMYIELDRFVVELHSEDKKEVYDINQYSHKSSVIRKPQLTVQDIENGKDDESCGNFCGWPKNLLIPRGKKDGMKGTLFVIASDWIKDGLNPQDHDMMFGPISYCGLKGETAMYPDMKPMGFPFDRQIVDRNEDPIEDIGRLMEHLPNSFQTDVWLNYLGDWMSQETRNEK